MPLYSVSTTFLFIRYSPLVFDRSLDVILENHERNTFGKTTLFTCIGAFDDLTNTSNQNINISLFSVFIVYRNDVIFYDYG